jgi:DNA-directed RNA polymerase subunit RPC12/RpoP
MVSHRTGDRASLREVIGKLEEMFSAFNERFFEGELEPPIITVNSTRARDYGRCAALKVWRGEKEAGYYEINLCAEHLDKPSVEISETLLHEMVHLMSKQKGIKDTSRSGTYHNKEFKRMAENHGLTVSRGKSGWHITKLNDESLEWVARTYGKENLFALHREKASSLAIRRSTLRKYACPSCGATVRTIKEVRVVCADCGVDYKCVGSGQNGKEKRK